LHWGLGGIYLICLVLHTHTHTPNTHHTHTHTHTHTRTRTHTHTHTHTPNTHPTHTHTHTHTRTRTHTHTHTHMHNPLYCTTLNFRVMNTIQFCDNAKAHRLNTEFMYLSTRSLAPSVYFQSAILQFPNRRSVIFSRFVCLVVSILATPSRLS